MIQLLLKSINEQIKLETTFELSQDSVTVFWFSLVRGYISGNLKDCKFIKWLW